MPTLQYYKNYIMYTIVTNYKSESELYCIIISQFKIFFIYFNEIISILTMQSPAVSTSSYII